jgi:predicted dehydrogenase
MPTAHLRIGVVGTTPYAETHLSRISAHPSAQLVAVAGRDTTRAAEVAARHRIPAVHGSFEELLDPGAIDAVVIVAPDELHEPIALSALSAGIHVLCEKPLARTPREARRMAEAARESGLVNMSYFALRTSPHHRYLHDLVAGGAIGRVRAASFGLAHGFFRGADYNWRFDASRGGGVVADLGSYLFDLARWYVGDVESVSASGRAHVRRPRPDGAEYPPADDSCVGALSFRDGAHATFEVSVLSQVGSGRQRNTVHLQGERGRLELTHSFAGATLRGVVGGSDELEDIVLPAEYSAPSGDAEFIDAIIAGVGVRPDFDDGWRVQQIVAAAETAAHSDRWIQIDEEEEMRG